jgi:hypothetical protein
MKRYLFILTLVCVVALFVGNSAADADGLIFMTAASFVATQHTDLGTPLGGLGFDPVAEKVEILARYTPNASRPLTIFEFEGAQASFGSFIDDFTNSIFSGPEDAFPAITVDSVHGVAYFLQDQRTRIVINPRHLNPRNPPANDFVDFIVNETGPAGITYDERNDTLIILLHSDSTNSGQQLIRTPFNSGIILSRTPLDATLAIDRDSEVTLNPTTGNYFVSVGSQVFEVAPNGIKTGRSFSSPNGQKVMGMEFGADNQVVILELDGTVSLGTLGMTAVTIDIKQGRAKRLETTNAKVTIAGMFADSSLTALDIGGSTMTITSVLNEVGVELVAGASLPLTLEARPGSDVDGATFETPGGARPRVRVDMSHRGQGVVSVRLVVEFAPSRKPTTCVGTPHTTQLTTSFHLDPAQVSVTTTRPWQCLAGDSHLRVPVP